MIMDKHMKRLSYKVSYRRFIFKHTCFLIANICWTGGYFFLIVNPTVYALCKLTSRRPQAIFLFVIPLIFITFATINCINIKQYAQEIISLLSGNFLVKSGRVVQKTKNVHTIGPIPSNRKPRKFEHISYPNFYIKDKNCERTFQIGDNIKVIYPCSSRLSTRSMLQAYAIYAFATDEAYSISMNAQKAELKSRKKIVWMYLSVVTLLSVPLLSALFVSIWILLKKAVFT